jgi:hypothetical protein
MESSRDAHGYKGQYHLAVECVKTRITVEPDRNLNHEDTKAREDFFQKEQQKCLSFSVFVSLWFCLRSFLIDRTSFYTVSVAGGDAKTLRSSFSECEPTAGLASLDGRRSKEMGRAMEQRPSARDVDSTWL